MVEKATGRNGLANDNDNIVDRFYLSCHRELKDGNKKAYLDIGATLEHGDGVKKDLGKAVSAYEKYYEEYRKLVRPKFNIIEFVIDIGNKHNELGNHFKAAEWYFKAAMHILEEHDDVKRQEKLFKKYKLEQLLVSTGYHSIV